jgi:hypothetical protein
MGVISHDTILSLCELLHIQPPPLVASGGRAALRCSPCLARAPPLPFGTYECDLLHIRCPQSHGFVPKQTLGGCDVYSIVDSNRDVDFHAGAREEVAYAAPDKWLNLFGRNLSTLNVSTACLQASFR